MLRPLSDRLVRSIKEALEAPLQPDKGSKVVPLEEAISGKLKPGMTVYIGAFANAATREIVRQFSEEQPGFTIAGGSQYYVDALVHYGLARRLIGPGFAYLFPVTRPIPAIQAAYREGKIEIEDWTVLTMVQRLIAGAMDQSCMTTKSVKGSSLADENSFAFKEVPDPFRPGESLAMVSALKPDLAILHGWASDTKGNVILGVPNLTSQDMWAARASRSLIVTVEQIVKPEFIRNHSCLVQIPARLVENISLVPFGAHPDGMTSCGMGIKEFSGYDPDIRFAEDHISSSLETESFSRRLKEWAVDCPSQPYYLNKLGQDRLAALQEKRPGWKSTLRSVLTSIPKTEKYNETEMLIVAAAGKIREIMLAGKYSSILIGMGIAGMAGRLAYYRMKKEGHDITLVLGTGIVGFSPRPANTRLATRDNIETAEMLSGSFDTYGVFVGGLNNKCLTLLGAGQIDKSGNINSTKMSETEYIAGSGGSNDGSNAEEVIVVVRQSRSRFVDRVHYVSCTGSQVTTLVSDRGIYEKPKGVSEFVLVAGYESPRSGAVEYSVDQIQETCGWQLKVAPVLGKIAPPSLEELVMLRVFDPGGVFTGRSKG